MSLSPEFCSGCGGQIHPNWHFCAACGRPLPTRLEWEKRNPSHNHSYSTTFQTLFDNPDIGVIIVNKFGYIEAVNAYLLKTLEYRPSLDIPTEYLSIVHEHDIYINTKHMTDICNNRMTHFSIDTRLKCKFSTFSWFHIYAMQIGTPVSQKIFCIVTDITNQKDAEFEARHLNAVVSSLNDIAMNIMNRLDFMDLLDAIIKSAVKLARANDGYIYILNEENDTMEMRIGVGRYEKAKMFQVRIDEGFGGQIWRLGKPIVLDNYSLWPESLPDAYFAGLRAAMGIPLKSGEQVTGVITISSDDPDRTFTNEEVLLLSRFASMASVALDNARLVTTLKQEIEERKRAEAALYESTELVRTILQSVKDFIYVKDASFRYLFANPGLAAFLGCTPEGMIGKLDAEFYDPEVAQHAKSVDQRVLEGEIVSEEMDITMQGEAHTFEIIKVPLRDKEGRVIALCGISRDITERKRAEAAMLEAREAIVRTERLASLGAMAAGIAHEINQPLNSIKVSATGILYWYKQGRARPMDEIMVEVREISAMADRIDRIIKHMRALSRSRERIDLHPCDLNRVIEQALEFIGSQLAAHGILVTLRLDEGLPPVMAPAGGLEEAVINMLVNSMQALDTVSLERKEIAIRTGHDAAIILEISDNGPGIQPEIQQRIFDPFFTTKVSTENMGFGLSIANSIVNSCNGKISISRSGEQGTTFRMEFPIRQSTVQNLSGATDREHHAR